MARIANSLAVLRAQIDAAYPNRNTLSDGWIGNEEHQQRASDHNPGADGVVEALDITHDPSGGMDTYRLAETLRLNRDDRLEYVISDGRIFYAGGSKPWQWQRYTGPNPHTSHIHISVKPDPRIYDDGRAWNLNRSGQLSFDFTNITATVFGGPSDSMSGARTAYSDVTGAWWDRPGVALPYRFQGSRPIVTVSYRGKTVDCPVIDVGPWNINDPYWLTGTRPQAESGTDMRGRTTNRAGIDLTPKAAEIIGLPGKALVDWRFKQEQPMAETPQDIAGQLKALREQFVTTLKALDELDRRVAVLLQPSTSVPVVVPPTPILEKPGVGTGVFGLILTAVLQSLGVIDATQPGTVGQLLPIVSAGTAALGATGWWGPLLQIGATVLSAIVNRKK